MQPRCSRGADQVQATTELATTLYPQTHFSLVKNPTLRIRELLEHRKRDKKYKQPEKVEQQRDHMTQGAGTPYPRNPEAMPRAADFFNKQWLS